MKLDNKYHLGTVYGVKFIADSLMIVGSLFGWFIFSIIAAKQAKLSWKKAILGGFLAIVFHWIEEGFHQLGHIWVSQRVGYPVTKIRVIGLFSQTVYPEDEPTPPPEVHIQRALSGPAASLLLSVFALIVARLLRPFGGLIAWLGQIFFRLSFYFATLGTLMPTDIHIGNIHYVSDGSSAWHWWKKKQEI